MLPFALAQKEMTVIESAETEHILIGEGTTDDRPNYRPIFVLLVVSRRFEKSSSIKYLNISLRTKRSNFIR